MSDFIISHRGPKEKLYISKSRITHIEVQDGLAKISYIDNEGYPQYHKTTDAFESTYFPNTIGYKLLLIECLRDEDNEISYLVEHVTPIGFRTETSIVRDTDGVHGIGDAIVASLDFSMSTVQYFFDPNAIVYEGPYTQVGAYIAKGDWKFVTLEIALKKGRQEAKDAMLKKEKEFEAAKKKGARLAKRKA